MSKSITAAVLAELAKQSGRKSCDLVKLEFDTGTVRLWTGVGDISLGGWDGGETYGGWGGLGKISSASEGTTVKDFRVTMTLSGVDTGTLNRAMNEEVQGRAAYWYKGYLDSSHALIADPVLVFRGRMDTMQPTLGRSGVVRLVCASRLADWFTARERLFNNEQQISDYAGDLFFEFITETVEKEIIWGGITAGGRGGGPIGNVVGVGQGDGNDRAPIGPVGDNDGVGQFGLGEGKGGVDGADAVGGNDMSGRGNPHGDQGVGQNDGGRGQGADDGQ